MKKTYPYAVAGLAALLLAACGNESDSGETAGTAAEETAAVETAEAPAPVAEETGIAIPEIPDLPPIGPDALGADIAKLASDDFEGRAPATAGGRKTTTWLERQFRDLGLEPAVGDSYLQPVPLVEITADPRRSSLVINEPDGSSRTLNYGGETVYWTKNVVPETSFENSEMVFVGFGIVAPEYGWNDYEGLDVEGKTVVIMVNDPGFYLQDEDLFNGRAMTYYGRWTYKYEEAARQGAAAAIIIHETAPAAYGWGVVEGSWTGPQLDLQRENPGYRAAMEGWIREEVARGLFADAGLDYDAQMDAAKSADFTPVPMGGLTTSGKITNQINRNDSANVAGILPGTTHPDEYVLYMAHWDHLGRTFAPIGGGASGGDTISNGAVDNATGTAGILNIARSFVNAEEKPERSILFVSVTAEESGLLGSAYMAEDPIVPLDKIVGGVNIDAMLPTPEAKDISVIGYGASQLEDLLKAAADKRGKTLSPDAEPEKGSFYRSDHISLAKKGVPMLYADAGLDLIDGGLEAGLGYSEDYVTNRYHKPSDEYSEDWDLTGMISTLEILRDVGAYMAYSDIEPNWYEGNEFRALRDEMMADE